MTRNLRIWTVVLIALFMPLRAQTVDHDFPGFKVLVFYAAHGYRHSSIPPAMEMFKRMDSLATAKPGFFNPVTADFTDQVSVFNAGNLAKYKVVVLLQTTDLGSWLNDNQKQALLDYVNHQGGLVAIHGALDASPSWGGYVTLLGGAMAANKGLSTHSIRWSENYGKVGLRGAVPIMTGLPSQLTLKDEWYSLQGAEDLSLEGSDTVAFAQKSGFAPEDSIGSDLVVAWIRDLPKGGRVFSTTLGHTAEAYADCGFKRLLRNGILWAGYQNWSIPEDVGSVPGWDCPGAATGNRAVFRERPGAPGFTAERNGNALKVTTLLPGSHRILLRTLDGKVRASAQITGAGSHEFRGLRPGTVYALEVRWNGGRAERRLISPEPGAP